MDSAAMDPLTNNPLFSIWLANMNALWGGDCARAILEAQGRMFAMTLAFWTGGVTVPRRPDSPAA